MIQDIMIKKAFNNVKEDISILKEALELMIIELKEIKETIKSQSHNSLSQSQSVSSSLTKSKNKIETKIINRIKRSKKKIVISEIKKLLPSTTIQDIKVILVDEKGLCSKASFYRYINSLESQKIIETETEMRLL